MPSVRQRSVFGACCRSREGEGVLCLSCVLQLTGATVVGEEEDNRVTDLGNQHQICAHPNVNIWKYLLQAETNTSQATNPNEALESTGYSKLDYTNPYLPVNSTAIEGPAQSVVGPDGKKKEPESNVLLASIENMQYAVTVDVLHTVFSAFGTVQKIAIFEKNGGTQALIQYPDIATASVAKETLEGHCIYDGGYCKLHLSYSRHTDLNVKAYSDKSRDYTIPDASLLASAPGPSLPSASAGWQNSQAPSPYPGNNYNPADSVPPGGQMPAWDPNMQARGQTYLPAPDAYPGQAYPQSSMPAYSAPAMPVGSSPFPHGMNPMAMTQPGVQSNIRPGGSAPPGQPPFYGR